MSKPNLSFCGNFSGKDDLSASRWLAKIEWEITKDVSSDEVPPKTFLKAIYLLVTEDAAAWTESNQEASEILAKRNPTQADVDTFCGLFQARFPARTYETSPENYNQELEDFHQAEDESLLKYYSRMKTLVHKMGAKERSPLPGATPLSHIDLMVLDTIFRAFLRGLNDADIRRETTKGMGSPDKSLRSLYLLAEEAKTTKAELDKLRKEEEKAREFQLYKDYANGLLDKSKLTALLSGYTLSDNAITTSNHEGITNITSSNNRFLHAPERRSQPRPEANYYRRPDNRSPIDRPPMDRQSFNQPVPKSLPDRKTSGNPYINGEKVWSPADGPLCVKCGEVGSRSNEDHQCLLLPAWERSYLRSIVFGDSAQASFVSYNYGQYDGNLKPYGHHLPHRMIRSRSEGVETPSGNSRVFTPESTVSFSDYAAPSYESKSLSLGFSSDFLGSVPSIESFYGEGSSKRPHMDDPSQSTQGTVLQDERMSQFPPPGERITKKGKKRAGKKAEMAPLVGMFNDILGTYDKAIPIRDVLKEAKVDLTWMDFLAWSPAICRELKRVCTRVAKKRFPKPKTRQSNDQPMQPPQQPPPPKLPNFQWMPTQVVRPQQPQGYSTIEVPQMPVPPVVQQPISLQSFQPQPPQNLGQQGQQVQTSMKPPTVDPPTQEILKTSLKNKTVSSAETGIDERVEFLRELTKLEKAFRLPATVILGTVRVMLEKGYTQADQGSEMNVISPGMVRKLGLVRRSLGDIGLAGLTMETADHKETRLHSWTELTLEVEGIIRTIKCFIGPESYDLFGNIIEQYRLLLGLPWLYSVNAVINIRSSSIQIGDIASHESVRTVKGPELVFSEDHNLLMYPKSGFPTGPKGGMKPYINEPVQDDDDESDDESEDSEDNLSDVEEVPTQQDFR